MLDALIERSSGGDFQEIERALGAWKKIFFEGLIGAMGFEHIGNALACPILSYRL